MVRALDVARETVAAVDGLRGGRLQIASMPSQVVSPLTGLVASFVERYPGVQVAVGAAARPVDVREALRRGHSWLAWNAMTSNPEALAFYGAIGAKRVKVATYSIPVDRLLGSTGR